MIHTVHICTVCPDKLIERMAYVTRLGNVQYIVIGLQFCHICLVYDISHVRLMTQSVI